MTRNTTRTDRYWTKVGRSGPTDCWPWLASRNPCGYGTFRGDGDQLAHRFGYRLAFGDIPPNMCVCHTCDNPACQNPAHFFLGTPADNSTDKMSKGRQSRIGMPGEHHPNARFTDAQVTDIRSRYADGARQQELADEFGVSPATISGITRGIRWVRNTGPITNGKVRRSRGMAHFRATLTDSDVAEIRRAYAAHEATQDMLALHFGTTQRTIGRIVHNQTRCAEQRTRPSHNH